jgi:hypothetical protein
LAESPEINEAFLREVDEELRRSEMLSLWQRWRNWLIGGIGGGLALFGGYLWWQNDQIAKAGVEGEQMTQAIDALGAGKTDVATKALDALSTSSRDGYRASAKLTKAAMALQRGDGKGALAAYATVAADTSLAKPWRDLALIRQTSAEFDTLKPETVIARLKPLAISGNPWFGSAGEMVAIAYLKQNKQDLAGGIFASLAKDKDVPDSIRQRAQQMAAQFGVDTGTMTGKEPVQ